LYVNLSTVLDNKDFFDTLGYIYEKENDDVALVLHERTDLGDLKNDSADAIKFRGADGAAGNCHSSNSKFVHNTGGL
jgi:hypothetical protein